ncbi:permease prefix domain 1-containing protein [Catellatospora aurea]|uniref:Permease prefix domain 1-containing protein n=1 Tax=Catellatospora aurea TaxID=1337874 RepID=A0ABW2GZ67_9ACTN
MAGSLMSTAATADGNQVLNCYLAELATRLHGPRRARTRILTEIRDGLVDAIDARVEKGTPLGTAVAAAVNEFGDPATVARSFAGELATVSARHTIAAFILTGPLVGIWWLLLLHPQPWRAGAHAMLAAIPALPLVAIAVATAAATFARTGRLTRWLPETTPRNAVTAAVAIAALCIAGDLTILSMLIAKILAGSTVDTGLAVIAASASTLRATVTAAILVRCIRSRPCNGSSLPCRHSKPLQGDGWRSPRKSQVDVIADRRGSDSDTT